MTNKEVVRTFFASLWSDPALGIARYADAGSPEALAEAARHELDT